MVFVPFFGDLFFTNSIAAAMSAVSPSRLVFSSPLSGICFLRKKRRSDSFLQSFRRFRPLFRGSVFYLHGFAMSTVRKSSQFSSPLSGICFLPRRRRCRIGKKYLPRFRPLFRGSVFYREEKLQNGIRWVFSSPLSGICFLLEIARPCRVGRGRKFSSPLSGICFLRLRDGNFHRESP